MKILIAYDGSKEADNALADLSAAGLPAQAVAVVLGVANLWPDMVWPDYFGSPDPVSGRFAAMASGEVLAFEDRAKKEAIRSTRKAKGFLEKRFPGWKVTTQTRTGSPAEEILAKAEAWKPDLIVMGAHGRSAIGRLLIGSISQKVLHHAGFSMRISRGVASKQRAVRILVGFDGSADCEQALSAIKARRWPKGTQVRMLAVFNDRLILDNVMLSDSMEDSVKVSSLETSWTERRMGHWAKLLEAKGLFTEHESVYGDPRRELLRKAKQWPADCIFVGSRGNGALGRFLLGSVSSSVASHAKCTVEVVRNRKQPGGKK